ncbi:hypothetical protein [Halochromatium glycolicum]|uniref:Ice-binding protein C-terminal domain-containing protein n=1 Tax=Halochromatium glycolicum TaxID=85075 RepID=A0AAJ0U2T4_9GAMM|nr:hypothetical protein [Halochromatium glycolicum]MBK1704176.1 hypothetical protein [Halochromatium glycolicum]
MCHWWRTVGITALTLMFMTGAQIRIARAAPVFYNESSAFFTAISDAEPRLGSLSIIDFDDVNAGASIQEGSVFGGVRFRSNTIDGLVVTDHFQTTSGLNYLGLDDGFSNEFRSGDELRFGFPDPVLAFALSIIGSPSGLLANDLQLVAAGGNVFNLGTPERVFQDGGELFFLGVIAPEAFSAAQLISFGDPTDPFFNFNIDDVTTVAVPLPPTLALFGLGLVGLGALRRIRPTAAGKYALT